jgi:hypothetical protein
MSLGIFYLIVLAAPVAVVGVSALAASALRGRRDKLLADTGRRATGRVLASGSDSDGLGSSTYWVKVVFPYDGEPVTAKVVVSRRDQQGYRAGLQVGLTYAPSRPQVVRLDPPEWALRQAR